MLALHLFVVLSVVLLSYALSVDAYFGMPRMTTKLQLGEGGTLRELELFFENASDSGKDKIQQLSPQARAKLTQRCLGT